MSLSFHITETLFAFGYRRASETAREAESGLKFGGSPGRWRCRRRMSAAEVFRYRYINEGYDGAICPVVWIIGASAVLAFALSLVHPLHMPGNIRMGRFNGSAMPWFDVSSGSRAIRSRPFS